LRKLPLQKARRQTPRQTLKTDAYESVKVLSLGGKRRMVLAIPPFFFALRDKAFPKRD